MKGLRAKLLSWFFVFCYKSGFWKLNTVFEAESTFPEVRGVWGTWPRVVRGRGWSYGECNTRLLHQDEDSDMSNGHVQNNLRNLSGKKKFHVSRNEVNMSHRLFAGRASFWWRQGMWGLFFWRFSLLFFVSAYQSCLRLCHSCEIFYYNEAARMIAVDGEWPWLLRCRIFQAPLTPAGTWVASESCRIPGLPW